jgi:hypothetical protein
MSYLDVARKRREADIRRMDVCKKISESGESDPGKLFRSAKGIEIVSVIMPLS